MKGEERWWASMWASLRVVGSDGLRRRARLVGSRAWSVNEWEGVGEGEGKGERWLG